MQPSVVPSDDSSTSSLSRIIEHHALHFFLRMGGKFDDWEEATRQGMRDDMLERWQRSEWGGGLKRRTVGSTATTQWVGGSFEVGDVLGVNILEDPPAGPSLADPPRSSSSTRDTHAVSLVPSTVGESSFVTANSSLSSIEGHPATNGDALQPVNSNTETSETRGFMNASPSPNLTGASYHAASTEALIVPEMSLNRNKSRKNVHYVDEPPTPQLQLTSEEPAAPSEVLNRSGDEVNETSAGATAEVDTPPLNREGIVYRDRMLVRVSYTKSENLSRTFNEHENRVTSHLRYEDWAEFLVVWRKDRIELYEDYSMPGKEWVTGHKHLAFVIPLRSRRTQVSLYSFTDLSFCILCPPTPVHNGETKARQIFHLAKVGTNVFIFKTKSRTRAVDWVWHLWQKFGGEIPTSLEIRCPNIDSRIKLAVPVGDTTDLDKAFAMFSKSNIINLVRNSLKEVSGSAVMSDWEAIISQKDAVGKSIELAWRSEAKLDWIWWDKDVDGNSRDWAMLCGMALKQAGKPAQLELRLQEHFPSTLHLSNGVKMQEPPGLEGYLNRIKPRTQVKQEVYVSTHDGNLFFLAPGSAGPPTPPNVHLSSGVLPPADDIVHSLRNEESHRESKQVQTAYGVIDLRHILLVRRATDPTPHIQVDVTQLTQEAADYNMHPEFSLFDPDGSDNEDEGGEAGLSNATNKPGLRLKRSFEIIMESGTIVRFEAYSCNVCLEWLMRLRSLVLYWKQRHRIDAHDEMEVAYSASRQLRLTPRVTKCHQQHGSDHAPEPLTDPEAPMPALSSLYHWCVLLGCRPIIKSGRAFVRKGLRGQYKLVQLFLVAGHLIQYHVSPRSPLHHRRSKEISLLDAYVCSGYLAALTLRREEFRPDNTAIARHYNDGLETEDPEEDTLFIIWYRKNKSPPSSAMGQTNTSNIPSLSAKNHIAVFRTRSKIERDTWCWALNHELDKMARDNVDRERLLRGMGKLKES
ncbi:hypothetical protein CONPUDRAFT_103997 [Coniophora puteana RWD-64-598 SS2]|uniref:PH domain-containing protein n=1 Tax=Coniophora puteana (strain RWD-64-598) TaxID=741705 RepID=A0A5M3MP52_CONPW|nr:uncharacterized protein CONPUDRAFT_103997 [Coniophora puteana RWD-64-598 SS2]EIW80949.1 hypothetical protein CONPUDRAFT_103997 [Coniophora puteana RWD-64-598 SS2]